MSINNSHDESIAIILLLAMVISAILTFTVMSQFSGVTAVEWAQAEAKCRGTVTKVFFDNDYSCKGDTR